MCGWEPHLRKTVVVAYFVGAARSSVSPVHPMSRGLSRMCGWELHLRKKTALHRRRPSPPLPALGEGAGGEGLPALRRFIPCLGACRGCAAGSRTYEKNGAAPTAPFSPLSQPWERGQGVRAFLRFAGSSHVSGPVEDVRLGAAPTKKRSRADSAFLPLSQPWERGQGVRPARHKVSYEFFCKPSKNTIKSC